MELAQDLWPPEGDAKLWPAPRQHCELGARLERPVLITNMQCTAIPPPPGLAIGIDASEIPVPGLFDEDADVDCALAVEVATSEGAWTAVGDGYKGSPLVVV